MRFLTRFFEKQKDPEKFKSIEFANKVSSYGYPSVPEKDEYHFKHSGNIGDVIYAIPVMKAIAKNKPIHLHLQIDQKVSYGRNIHPLGNVMLNRKMVELLSPLLLGQPGFVHCDVWDGRPVDVDLDIIRKYPIMLNRGHISRWYFLMFGAFYPLEQPWLQIDAGSELTDAILICRSQRYHAPGIRYDFLSAYPEVYFAGLPQEFEAMQNEIPSLRYKPVNNFLELAGLIAGCRLFIGNQSFPFALAEAMKVNRLLEWYFQTPNVVIDGPRGFDFCFQPHFEKLVRQRFNNRD